MAFAENAHTYA